MFLVSNDLPYDILKKVDNKNTANKKVFRNALINETKQRMIKNPSNSRCMYNLDIDPALQRKMDKDPKLRDIILKKINNEFNQPEPYTPGYHMASLSVTVHPDGSITSIAIGEPDKKTVENAKRADRENAEKRHKKLVKRYDQQQIDNEKALINRAELMALSRKNNLK